MESGFYYVPFPHLVVEVESALRFPCTEQLIRTVISPINATNKGKMEITFGSSIFGMVIQFTGEKFATFIQKKRMFDEERLTILYSESLRYHKLFPNEFRIIVKEIL